MDNLLDRRHDVDWLRMLAVVLLVPFHTAVIYTPGARFYLHDQPNIGLAVFVFFTHRWHMPLLFLVSGIATWFSLGHRTPDQYAKERVARLFLPLVFGTLTLASINVYFMRLQSGEFKGSFFEFYPHFFEGAAPQGNLEWGHLWFVAYLFLYSLLALPLFVYLRQDKAQHVISRLAAVGERRFGFLLFGVPFAVIEVIFRAKWPGFQNLYDDWANLLLYLTYFIYGYLLCGNKRFWKAIENRGKIALSLGLVFFLLILGLLGTGRAPEPDYSFGWILYMILHGFTPWFWVVAILSFGRKYLNSHSAILEYANEAVLPFYILHLPFVITIGYYVVPWNVPPVIKFLVISLASLFAVIVAYEFVVKRISATRFLFGMKPKTKK